MFNNNIYSYRYVGNKWNVLFLMPAIILEHRLSLAEYLEKFCRNESALRTDLVWAIKSEKVVTQLRALALIGFVITTPWMEEFYGNKDRLSNLEMVPKLKLFSSKIQEFVEDVSLILSATHTIFGQPLKRDALLLWLQDTLPTEELYQCLRMMLLNIKEVSGRQLHRYTSGELSNVTQEMLQASRASTPHNVWAERALGALNSYWDRAKQASVGFLETRVKISTNKLKIYLDSLDKDSFEGLIKFAVKAGAKLYRERVEAKKDLKRAAARKMRATAQKRDEKKRRDMEKELVVVLKAGNGGVRNELYDGLDVKERNLIDDIVGRKSLKDVVILHDWIEEDGEMETYRGQLLNVVKRGNGLHSYKIDYWLAGLKEESLSTYNVQAEKLIVDILLGDLRVLP